jgi:hypothetical protein
MRRTIVALALLTGCYGSREAVTPTDAFQRPDVGSDARRGDPARQPDAFAPDAFAPDAFAPDAVVVPDAWPPELGTDCSLGGPENAFEMSGGHVPSGTRLQSTTSIGWTATVSRFDRGDVRTIGHRITIATPEEFFFFESPRSEMFTPGEYRNTQSFSPAPWGYATVRIGGCTGTGGGVLTIHEITVVDQVLRRLRASYREPGCHGAPVPAPFSACIRYTAP